MENHCDICGKTFNSKGSLSVHKRVIHDTVRQSCDQCSRTFQRKYQLKEHVEHVHKNSKTLSKHIKTSHLSSTKNYTKEMKHQCEICSKSFHKKLQLNVHMNKNHGGFKMCDLCDRRFKSSTALMYHKKTKHLEIKYNCNYCKLKLSSKGNYKKHMERKHSKKIKAPESNPILNCETCDLRFMSSKILLRHERICSAKRRQGNESQVTEIEATQPEVIKQEAIEQEVIQEVKQTQSRVNQSNCTEQEFTQSNIIQQNGDQLEPTIVKQEPIVMVENPLTTIHFNNIKQEVSQNIPESHNISQKIHPGPDIIIETPLDDFDTDEEFGYTEATPQYVSEDVNSTPGYIDPDVIIETPLDNDNSGSDFEETENLPEESSDPDIIIESVVKMEKSTSIICKPCNQNFESELDLGVHIGMTHSVTVMKCPKCTKFLLNQREFIAHEC